MKPSAETERKRPRLKAVLVSWRVLGDLLAIHVGFGLSYWLYDSLIGAEKLIGAVPAGGRYAEVLVLYAAINLLVFWQLGMYRERATVLNLGELQMAAKGVTLSAAFLFASLFFLKLGPYRRMALLGAIALSLLLIVLERRVLSAIVAYRQRRGARHRAALIFGCGETGRLLMKKIVQAPHLGLHVVGFLDDFKPIGSVVSCRITQTRPEFFRAPVLGRMEDLPELVAKHDVDELLVAAALFSPHQLREIVESCRRLGVNVGVVPALAETRADQLVIEDLSAIPVLRPSISPTQRLYPIVKRIVDVAGALLLLLITLPVWVIAAVAIRLDSPGPILFRQDRIGQGGWSFRMYKFRTMAHDVNPYAPSPPHDVDPGITRVGRVLRQLGLDEFPQLINVLRGEMSLVGPRPEMPFIVERYTPFQRQRLQAKPGITGLWQVSADRHGPIHENIEYDLYYLAHRSFLLDALILFETAFFTLGLLVKGVATAFAGAPAPPRGVPAESEPVTPQLSYVLVAFDQRNGTGAPRNWEIWLPAVHALARRWPVRLLAAQENVGDFDALLSHDQDGKPVAPVENAAPANGGIGYVPYRSRAELQTLTMNAGFVLTDLSHVEEWARTTNVDVVTVRSNELYSAVRSNEGRRILADLVDVGKQFGSLTVRMMAN